MKLKRNYFMGGMMAAVKLLVVLFLVCSCSSKDEYCSAIPGDAVALVKVDAVSFLKKHDLSLDALKEAAGPDAQKMLENLGIDVQRPVYVFVTPKGEAGAVAAIKDKKALVDMISAYGSFAGVKTSEKKGYNWIEGSSFIGAFDDSRVLLLSGAGMNARQRILDLMEQKEDESVLSTNMYAKLTATEKPLALIFGTQNIPADIMQPMIQQVTSMYDIEAKDVDGDFLATFDIEKDKAILAFEFSPNTEKLQALIDENCKNIKKIDGKFINTISENPALWVAGNLQGDKIMEIVEKQLSTALVGVDDEAKASLQPALDAVKTFLASLNGDVNVIMPSFEAPNFIAQLSTRDKSILDLVASVDTLSKGQMNVMAIGTDAYCMSDGNTPIFCSFKDGVTYISNSQDLTNAAGASVSSAIDDLKSEITNSYFYVSVDAKPLVAMMLQNSNMRAVGQLYAARLNNLDRFTIVCSSPQKVEMTLSVADGKDFVETLFK